MTLYQKLLKWIHLAEQNGHQLKKEKGCRHASINNLLKRHLLLNESMDFEIILQECSLNDSLFFMLPEGRAYSRRFVYPSDHRPSNFCPDHISKSIEGNLMKLDTLIEGHEGNCRMQET